MSTPRVLPDPARDTERLLALWEEILEELDGARMKFPPFNSPHEGYAVILEELDELWDEVKANRGRTPTALAEARQIAAMALWYLLDMGT